MKIVRLLLGLILALGSALPSSAGMFRITAIWYAISPSHLDCYKLVYVPATAKYFGPVDDNDWFIQTSLNYGPAGSYLDNWSQPSTTGGGKNGAGIFTGMVIECKNSCAANAAIKQADCGEQGVELKGRAGVASYYQFAPEIDTVDGHVETLDCCEGNCLNAVEGKMTYLSLAETDDFVLPTAPLTLSRRETLGGITYLMEEWAVVSFSNQGSATPLAKVLRSSSAAFDSARSPDLVPVLRNAKLGPAAEGATLRDTTVLLIGEPIHPHNSRRIHLPAARLTDTRLPFRAAPAQVIVRADYSEDRFLQDFQVLHATDRVSTDLEDFLAQHLELRYHSEKRHRVILFAVLQVGEEGVEMRQSRTVLPRCCCPEWPQCPI